jgi:hypothetical protein
MPVTVRRVLNLPRAAAGWMNRRDPSGLMVAADSRLGAEMDTGIIKFEIRNQKFEFKVMGLRYEFKDTP